ncbi:hypothetical protein A2U01_0038988, partial [Trifolium medium]|nr:hypothetical protein [Trifolium medium]
MYWEAFKAMQLAGEQLKPYNGTLVGFAGEQVEVMGHITLLTTFGVKENAKTIKYPLDDGRIGMVRGDQALGRQCYESSLRLKSSQATGEQMHITEASKERVNAVETTDLDPREEFQDRRVSPIEELESIKIGEAAHQTTSLGTHLGEEEKD